jgi:hypothetical protein
MTPQPTKSFASTDSLPAAERKAADAARRAALAAANINPNTGLATDYLNHFNEAIMLLEMVPAMPETAVDFLAWHPLTYAEHFVASHFKGRDLAIAAYDQAPADVRATFDQVCTTMTSILTAIRDAVAQSRQDVTKMRLAEQAVGWLKPLVAQAGAIINGTDNEAAETARPQSDADRIMLG